MKIQKVEIKNFKGLDHASADLKGKNVYLIAPNGKGKTSFIDACFGVMPSKALKDGERRGKVEIEIDDYTVQFDFTEKKQAPKLNIFDKSGKPQPAPATLFKNLFGAKDFDIDKFLALSDSKQIDFIKNIIGLDWSGLEAERKTAYDERTFLNRKVKELDAKIEGKSFNPNLQEVDVSALNRKRDDIVRDNSTIARITEELIRKEVERKGLENDLKAIEDRLVGLSIDITKGENWLLKKKLTKTDEIDEQIKNASELNSAFIINEENGRLRKESRTTWENIEALEEQIAEIDQAKKDELANCEMPVKGLTFEDDKLFLNGLPFNTNQINTAKRIIAGLEIQFALMSEMKIARFDGSLLDKNSMAEVEAWAESKGIQLFVELVDRDGDILKIEISES